MNINQLALLTTSFLSDNVPCFGDPAAHWKTDERTIRFYHTEKYLARPKKEGRELDYSNNDARKLVLLKLLQENHVPLSRIKTLLDDCDSVLEKQYGIDIARINGYIDTWLAKNSEEVEEETEEPQGESQTVKMEESETETEKMPTNPTNILVEVTSHVDFDPFNKVAKFGDNFVFVDALPETTGKALHRMLHGQRSKVEAITRATLPIDGELFVPGATLKALETKRGSLTLVADKDVYKENDDIVRIFAYDPIRSSRKVSLEVKLDGALIEKHEIVLNKNGCGLIRFQALSAGQYTVEDIDKEGKASFTSARYELDPLTATLAAPISKVGDDLTVSIKAEAFSNPYSGAAIAKVMAEGSCLHVLHVEFKKGVAKLSFKASSDAAMSVQIVANGKIASVPLSGSSKAQREDTEASALGRVVSVSLLGSKGATKERGLFFSEGAITNSPITLESCIADTVSLKMNGKVEDACVIIRQPDYSGKTITTVHEVKPGAKWESPTLKAPFASVHVGAFIDGKPWEGHAMVFRKARFAVKLECKLSQEPGDTMALKIKSKKDASVLLRIADKRMRTQETPMTAAATRLKEWIGTLIGGRKTGFVNQTWTTPLGAVGWGGGQLESFGGTRRYMAAPTSLRVQSSMMRSAVALYDDSKGATYDFANRASDNFDEGLVGDGEIMYAANCGLESGGNYEIGTSSIAAQVVKEVQARESDSDLIYTGLIEVQANKTKTLNIKLPDSIGNFDVTAFSVSDGDWIESETEFAIEKFMYVVPAIPAYAHPDDGVKCRAYVVAKSDFMVHVLVNGQPVDFDMTRGNPTMVEWDAR